MAVWISDGSSGFTIHGNVVTYKGDVGGDNVVNCLWKDDEGVSIEKHYWQIRLETLEGVAGVGVTSKDYFRQGYECKSLQYSSDLTDGSKILVKEFGPTLETGDVIGILVSFDDDRLNVYFDINGMNLGKAFVVDSAPFETIYPMVSFHKSGSATCERVTDVPTVTRRVRSVYSGIEGNWNIKSVEANGTVSHDLVEVGITSIRKTKANEYAWNLLAASEFDTSLSKENGHWKTTDITCTRKFCPPELITVETQLLKLMEEVKVVEIDDDETLSIKSDDVSTLWTRCYWVPPYYFANGDPFEPKKSYNSSPLSLYPRAGEPYFYGKNYFYEDNYSKETLKF